MRSAVYQLKYMDSVPNSAVCNEAVKLATKKGFVNLKGFVNGVLRNIERNLENISYPDRSNLKEYLSVKYSMPEWILEQFLAAHGEEKTEQILEGFLAEKPITIRCNLDKISKEELTKHLEKEGVHVENHPYLPYALWISSINYLAELESFQNGEFYVQDVSSMMVAQIADPKEGQTVIDVCAAPGGKSLHIAELLKGTGHVEARDLTAYKVNMIEENIMRSECTNIHAVQWDATQLDEQAIETADIVIADLPCSGLGVLGKKTDLKYKMTKETQEDLVKLQRTMLEKVHQYVKPGGTLVYSTCTIHEEENLGNVHWFLENHEEFDLVPIKELVCEELQESIVEEGTLQFLPDVHKCDGFFIAKFRRRMHE